ncbi:MAG: Ku protein [Aureliella sp.]
MARPVWSGNITFGLVNVPVVLYSAERRADLNLHLIDSRNDSKVRYERVNDETGEEVPWDKIVKGYEFDGGNLVLLSEDELEHASPELTRTIDVAQFVAADEIDPIYYDKPYYLLPGKGGTKGYVLLRDALEDSERVALATVVIRTRQYVAALRPHNEGMVLQLLRYEQELRDLKDFDMPEIESRKIKASKQERDMAMQLIDGMTDKFEPDRYHDEYHDAVMKLIQDKIASGETDVAEPPQADEDEDQEPTTINFIEVLRRSVEQTSGKSHARKSASSKSTTRHTRPGSRPAARKKAKKTSAAHHAKSASRSKNSSAKSSTTKKRSKKKHAS